ncbi:carnitinyl-CoA dehydratase [Rhodococcus pyridinivorans AK37]|uniref:Carnitinyl-CoA dehydratase n=1 Tax=Rhodococcus pyridinivorans AK37 TaxID=1114960 RepID=H0JW30_9NOCA|nr:carnitinyl-CoA dehydratase [Rhodococcus pyridinivorans AK37]
MQAGKTVARGIIDGNVPAEDLPWELTDKALARLTTSADTLEGVMAFIQKREPVWKGE